jgi:ribosomal protein S18 acetylase RimI-like enzyme
MLTEIRSDLAVREPASISIELLRPSVDLAQYSQLIWSLMSRTDHEFVPRLSARNEDPAKLDLHSPLGAPVAFFDLVMSNYVLMATVDGQPAGLMSFQARYSNSSLPEYVPCTYVLMTVVEERFRRVGVATRMNEVVESLPDHLRSPWIGRRVWSTNYANIALLQKRGFTEAVRIRNHRGPGVDTVYVVRRTNT